MSSSSNIGKKVVFIGGGQMATALLLGFTSAGLLEMHQVYVVDPNGSQRQRLLDKGVVNIFQNAAECLSDVDLVFLCVKPQIMNVVLDTLSVLVSHDQHLLVSIAAGISLDSLQARLPASSKVIRVMPNTPCLVGAAASAMCGGRNADVADCEMVETLFGAVGSCVRVPEALMDAVTGLCGSGPAYVFVMIEALADGGVKQGLPRHQALQMAAQTVFGAAKMVLQTGLHPAQLKDAVASPAGTTIAGIHALEKGSIRSTLINAVEAAASRSGQLSKPPPSSSS